MQAELGTDLAVEEFKRGKHGGCKASPSLDWDVSVFPTFLLTEDHQSQTQSIPRTGRKSGCEHSENNWQ